MTPFIIIFIVLLVINILFLACGFVHTFMYGKSKPESVPVGSPRMSAASMMLNRQLNPRLSLQPQVTLIDLIRVSTGSSAYSAQMEGQRTSMLSRN